MRGCASKLARKSSDSKPSSGITTILVTHDQIEAMTMAERVAVMRAGKIEQLSTPAELYSRPANLFVASFIGDPPMNLISMEYSVSQGIRARSRQRWIPIDAASTVY